MKTINYFFSIVIGLILLSCNNNAVKTGNNTESGIIDDSIVILDTSYGDSLKMIIESIISISTKDFKKSFKDNHLSFRYVSLKKLIRNGNEILYVLCGEYSLNDPKDDKGWTAFATIKNSDYEQWLGGSAIGFCNEAKEISDLDLTDEMNSKYQE